MRDELKLKIFELQKSTQISIVDDSKIQQSEPKAEQLFNQIIQAWGNYSNTVNTTIKFVEAEIRIAEFINVTIYEKSAYNKITEAILNYNNHQLAISEEVYQTAQDNSIFAFWAVVVTTIIEAVILKIILAYVLNLVRQYVASKKQHEEELITINRELALSLSDLKQVQVKLIESEKMALLGQLVAGVSHELNTPVGVGIVAATNMNTCSKTIEQSLAKGEVTEEELDGFIKLTQESAVIIEKNLRRAGELIKSFKDVAVEQHSEEFREFSLSEALEDILLSMKPKLREGGHSIDVTCPSELMIETNLGAIYHVLTNLIINAITHGFEQGQSGQLTLVVKQVDQDNIHINFSDNGKGMSEEVRQKIFTPFYTTNRKGGGTGLGLSIAYNAIAKIGGHIRCESALGQGAHFFIELKCRVVSSVFHSDTQD